MESFNESFNESFSLNESLNRNSDLNKSSNEILNEEIKKEEAKDTEIIPLIALAPIIISGAITVGGLIADKVLESKRIEEHERHNRAFEAIEKAKSSIKDK